MRIRTAITAAALLASLVACGSRPDTADSKATPSPTSSPTPTARVFDVHDCRALLERNYDNDALRDATGDPECAQLTRDEYVKVVGEVLTGRKGEILEDAANEAAWDEAWEGTDTAQQGVVCGRLIDEGAIAVGQEMMDTAAEPAGTEIDMVQYFLDEKC